MASINLHFESENMLKFVFQKNYCYASMERLSSNIKIVFLNELLDLLRIPSVSARTEHKDDMIQCAEVVKQRMLEAGAEKAKFMQPKVTQLYMVKK